MTARLQLDPATDYHADALIDAWLQDGVPVLVRDGGRYPDVLVGDESTRHVPHVDVAVYRHRCYCGDTDAWVTTRVELVVTAIGRVVRGRRRSLDVHTQTCRSQDAAVQLGRRHVGDALTVLADVDARYDAAEARIAEGEAYRDTALSREAYEAACRVLGVDELSDGDIDSYGVRYGDFDYPSYRPDYIVQMRVAAGRLHALDAARAEQPLGAAAAAQLKDSGFYRPDASATDARCARCGAQHAAWIAGAGEALCVRHQDDY